jgi:hypothetical protein
VDAAFTMVALSEELASGDFSMAWPQSQRACRSPSCLPGVIISDDSNRFELKLVP